MNNQLIQQMGDIHASLNKLSLVLKEASSDLKEINNETLAEHIQSFEEEVAKKLPILSKEIISTIRDLNLGLLCFFDSVADQSQSLDVSPNKELSIISKIDLFTQEAVESIKAFVDFLIHGDKKIDVRMKQFLLFLSDLESFLLKNQLVFLIEKANNRIKSTA